MIFALNRFGCSGLLAGGSLLTAFLLAFLAFQFTLTFLFFFLEPFLLFFFMLLFGLFLLLGFLQGLGLLALFFPVTSQAYALGLFLGLFLLAGLLASLFLADDGSTVLLIASNQHGG